ncbi:MAG: hypothetical protein JW751_22555 [Polyangiaceae bacterium]|nr:hypothetical protein [Polyangiaceae bacterium]
MKLAADVASATSRAHAVCLINEALLEVEDDLVAAPVRTRALTRTALLAGALGATTEALALSGPCLIGAMVAVALGGIGAGMVMWFGRAADGLAKSRRDQWNRLARRLELSWGAGGEGCTHQTGSPDRAAIS